MKPLDRWIFGVAGVLAVLLGILGVASVNGTSVGLGGLFIYLSATGADR